MVFPIIPLFVHNKSRLVFAPIPVKWSQMFISDLCVSESTAMVGGGE